MYFGKRMEQNLATYAKYALPPAEVSDLEGLPGMLGEKIWGIVGPMGQSMAARLRKGINRTGLDFVLQDDETVLVGFMDGYLVATNVGVVYNEAVFSSIMRSRPNHANEVELWVIPLSTIAAVDMDVQDVNGQTADHWYTPQKSVVGRAVVGAALGGVVGAAVGAATAMQPATPRLTSRGSAYSYDEAEIILRFTDGEECSYIFVRPHTSTDGLMPNTTFNQYVYGYAPDVFLKKIRALIDRACSES